MRRLKATMYIFEKPSNCISLHIPVRKHINEVICNLHPLVDKRCKIFRNPGPMDSLNDVSFAANNLDFRFRGGKLDKGQKANVPAYLLRGKATMSSTTFGFLKSQSRRIGPTILGRLRPLGSGAAYAVSTLAELEPLCAATPPSVQASNGCGVQRSGVKVNDIEPF